jgi:hypothetical protein
MGFDVSSTSPLKRAPNTDCEHCLRVSTDAQSPKSNSEVATNVVQGWGENRACGCCNDCKGKGNSCGCLPSALGSTWWIRLGWTPGYPTTCHFASTLLGILATCWMPQMGSANEFVGRVCRAPTLPLAHQVHLVDTTRVDPRVSYDLPLCQHTARDLGHMLDAPDRPCGRVCGMGLPCPNPLPLGYRVHLVVTT